MKVRRCSLTILLLILLGLDGGQCSTQDQFETPANVVSILPGHWPAGYCHVTNVVFDLGRKVLLVHRNSIQELERCFGLRDIWTVEPLDKSCNDMTWDQLFRAGHFFTVYYYHGSNYFHLHYDTLLPLYSALYGRGESSDLQDVLLLPGVEAERGRKINWDVDAFLNGTTYWNEMLQSLAGPRQILPLDSRLSMMNKTVCFQDAYFGTPKVNFSDPKLISGFVERVRRVFDIPIPKNRQSAKPRVGIIHREGRRRILNEADLIKGIKKFAKGVKVNYSGMPFKEQVWQTQELDVLVGMNGAGLTNAIYLPSGAVAIQLVPYEGDELNVHEFQMLLEARGPYLEWHNVHPERNVAPTGGASGLSSDTNIDVDEFVRIVRKATGLLRLQGP